MASPPPLDLKAHLRSLSGDRSSIDFFELRVARRAVLNPKTPFCGQALIDLLQDQISRADEYFHSIIEESSDQWNECRVNMHVEGTNANESTTFTEKKRGCSRKDEAGELQLGRQRKTPHLRASWNHIRSITSYQTMTKGRGVVQARCLDQSGGVDAVSSWTS